MAINQADTFSFAATGDAMLTREIIPYEGNADVFDNLLALLRGADATATNLEVLLHDYEGYPSASSGGTFMRSPRVWRTNSLEWAVTSSARPRTTPSTTRTAAWNGRLKRFGTTI